jgi:hypothetical protein
MPTIKRTWTCTECGKEFGVGEWTCADGTSNHKVELKTYRSLDVPTAEGTTPPGILPPVIRSRTMVCNVPPPHKIMDGGDAKMVGEGSVEFINGVFLTTDPEQQYWLDKKPGYQATKEQYDSVWLSAEARNANKEIELKAREERLENDRNDLLGQTQAKVKRETARP